MRLAGPRADARTMSEIRLGATREHTFHVDERVVDLFGDASQDRNPLHFDEAYAAGTLFGGRIAHGMLAASFISAVLGNELPGHGTVYLGQSLRFRAPVRVGDDVRVVVSVAELEEPGRATLRTQAFVGDVLVVDGEASVLLPAGSPPRRVRRQPAARADQPAAARRASAAAAAPSAVRRSAKVRVGGRRDRSRA
jgi:3-hydroxybutyryl-CoA dehydratase